MDIRLNDLNDLRKFRDIVSGPIQLDTEDRTQGNADHNRLRRC